MHKVRRKKYLSKKRRNVKNDSIAVLENSNFDLKDTTAMVLTPFCCACKNEGPKALKKWPDKKPTKVCKDRQQKFPVLVYEYLKNSSPETANKEVRRGGGNSRRQLQGGKFPGYRRHPSYNYSGSSNPSTVRGESRGLCIGPAPVRLKR